MYVLYILSSILFYPAWLSSLLPEKAFQIEETGWSAYPFGRSVLHSRLLDHTRLSITLDTQILEDDGCNENAHGLTAEELAIREIGTFLVLYYQSFKITRIRSLEVHRIHD